MLAADGVSDLVGGQLSESLAVADVMQVDLLGLEARESPRLSQLDSCFIERGTLLLKRLHRAAVIELSPMGNGFPGENGAEISQGTLRRIETRLPLPGFARHWQV